MNGEIFDAENIGNVLVVAKEKIGENGDWNLSGERYRENDKLRISDYEIVELETIVKEIKTGFAFGKARKDSIGIAHLRPMNITEEGCLSLDDTKYIPENEIDNIGKYFLQNGDVLFNNTNSKELVGKTCFIDHNYECGFSNHMTRIRTIKDKIEGKYLATLLHFMWSKGIFLEKCNKWVGQAGINKSALSKIKIPLPPLEIQKEIVAEIEGYQKIIDGGRAVVDNYKPRIEIDPEWEMVKLGDMLNVARGGSPRPIQKFLTDSDEGINWIKIGDVAENDKYVTKTKQKIIQDGINKTRLVKDGDFILSNSMSFGRPYIVKIEGAIHDGWLLLRINAKEQILQDFLYYILGSDIVKVQYEKLATGGVVRNLNRDLVKSVEIPLPPLEIQNLIVAQIEKEQALVNANKELTTIFEQKIKDKIASVWGE